VQAPIGQPALQALKARYVFPVAGEPIRDGLVTLRGETIAAVGSDTPADRAGDLGNVALVPGLVNAHTHLDLSDLAEPLGKPGIALTDWVGEVMRLRGQRRSGPEQAVVRGLRESVACGTTLLGEIAQPGWQVGPLQSAPLETIVFLELIAPTAARVDPAIDLARGHLASARPSSSWLPGLGPHAPYSVHPRLLRDVVQLSQGQRAPVAFHLAESREEMELLRSGTGPFRDLLERLDAWDPEAFPGGRRPLDYLRPLAEANRALVIHGNYLDNEEITFLAGRADRMAVVYCPRSHAFFGHAEYPLTKLLASGATVALGTDSRASSPDLSVLAEMRFLARKHASIAGDMALRLGTLLGARALGRDHDLGSLQPGKQADLAAIALPEREAADPHELLFDSELPVIATWHKGTSVDEGRTMNDER
jgi:cytosine/adenosine deaminase-related metal-dependent hydrolase